jgi:adhesin transport system membrane fusion protein
MPWFETHSKDTDFMSELQAATRIAPTTPAVAMFCAIIALFVFAIVWAGVSQVDEITRGEGTVVPTQEIQVVQSLEGGILAELLVQNGEHVEKDQILMRISDVQFSSEERGTEAKFASLQAKKARLTAEANQSEFILPDEIKEKFPKISENELALYESRKKELANAHQILDDRINKAVAGQQEVQAQISQLAQSRTFLQKELDITREMVKKRAVPQLEQIRLERELSDIGGQINAGSERKKALDAELQVARREKENQNDQFRSKALAEMSDVEADMAGLEEQLKSIGDRVFRTELRSPVDGVINNIAVTTIGGVIEPAQRLVEIVPMDDALKIIARVLPSDIAFLRPGLDAKVKITAYDSQKYGSLNGKLVRIGANSVTDEEGKPFFEIEVRTDRNFMGDAENPLPISPGMVAQTEIITGKRTILEYLLKPVLRARDRAFTER